METSIKIVGLITLVILLVILLVSCSNLKSIHKPTLEGNDALFWKEIELEDFKYDVFMCILSYAYKDTKALEEIRKVDMLYSNSDFHWEYTFTNVVDSIGKSFVEDLPVFAGYVENKDDKGKKFYLRAALKFYYSNELDSLARRYLKISDETYKKLIKKQRE